jgi:hypothetical protein
MSSNHDWVVPAGIDDRRFCVLDVDPGHKDDHPYFEAIARELDNGGRAALLADLRHYDLSTFNVRAVPQTDALRVQKVLSLDANARWLFDKLMAGRWLPEHDDWHTDVLKDALHDDYIKTLQKLGVDRRRTETELGMFLVKFLAGKLETKRKRDNQGKLQWWWCCSNLSACRLAFDRATHSHHPWPED